MDNNYSLDLKFIIYVSYQLQKVYSWDRICGDFLNAGSSDGQIKKSSWHKIAFSPNYCGNARHFN